MKTKKIISNKHKTLELNLINSKILNKKKLINRQNIEQIKYQLKKSLQVIYKYHIEGKKILFIGLENKYKNLTIILKMTKHTWLSGINWLNGALTKKNSYFKNRNSEKTFIETKKKYDLIVVLNYEINKNNAINEGYINKIPIISLNIEPNILNNKCCYKVPGNFQFSEKPIRDNFFFSIL